MKRKSKLLIIILCILLVIGCMVVYSAMSNDELLTTRLKGNFVYNTDNPYAVVGYSDYVFIGYVKKLENTEYKTATNNKEHSIPYTNYTVIVIENIKGDLITGTPLSIRKFGG